MDFDKIVQKMRKRGQNLWSIADVGEYLEGEGDNQKKIAPYKLIHRLVSTGILTSIRKGMYLWADKKLDPEDYYWSIVKKIIAENYLSQGIIIGEKALAFGLRDYSLPETLSILVPKDARKLSIIGNYMMVANHVRAEKRSSLYPLIREYATRMSIEDTQLLVTCPEHALLEALTTRMGSDKTDTSIIERWLKKNGASLRESVFASFIPYRYISATNRLKYLASDLGMTSLYEMMVRLIDNQGKGCHLSRDFLAGKKK